MMPRDTMVAGDGAAAAASTGSASGVGVAAVTAIANPPGIAAVAADCASVRRVGADTSAAVAPRVDVGENR